MSQGIHKVAIILCDSAGHYNFVVAKPPVLKKKLQNGHYTLVSEPFFLGFLTNGWIDLDFFSLKPSSYYGKS